MSKPIEQILVPRPFARPRILRLRLANSANRRQIRKAMSKSKRQPVSTVKTDALFGRVVSIFEQARGNVVRAVNTQMVLAYWLIGREIVQELQGGKTRANYGERVVEDLSARLTERYGKGFSTRNIKLFKQFYLTWRKTSPIGQPLVAQSSVPEMGHPSVDRGCFGSTRR